VKFSNIFISLISLSMMTQAAEPAFAQQYAAKSDEYFSIVSDLNSAIDTVEDFRLYLEHEMGDRNVHIVNGDVWTGKVRYPDGPYMEGSEPLLNTASAVDSWVANGATHYSALKGVGYKLKYGCGDWGPDSSGGNRGLYYSFSCASKNSTTVLSILKSARDRAMRDLNNMVAQEKIEAAVR